MDTSPSHSVDWFTGRVPVHLLSFNYYSLQFGVHQLSEHGFLPCYTKRHNPLYEHEKWNNMPCMKYILKRKSFATLTKMLVPFFRPKQSLSGNAIDKSLHLPCIQHKNQNGVANDCRAATMILRQPPILKSHG